MKSIEQIGKTVEEAKQQAMEKLGLKDESQMEVEILDEGTKGVFGWGTKYARIRVKVPDDMVVEDEGIEEEAGSPEEEVEFDEAGEEYEADDEDEEEDDDEDDDEEEAAEEPVDEEPVDIKGIVSELLALMELKADVEEVKEGDRTQDRVNVFGENLGALIGKHGQTLEAFQFVINLIVNKQRINKKKVIIDVEGYRARREQSLHDLAVRSAQRAKRERRNVILEPMVPSERRIIHMALKNDPDISTYSNGQEPLRRVVIASRKAERHEGGDVRRNTTNAPLARRRPSSVPPRREFTPRREFPPRERERHIEHDEDIPQRIAEPVRYDKDHTIPEIIMPDVSEERVQITAEPPRQEIAPPVQFD
ncbi:MAG: Jag N-terminal domain-containing protein [Chloroflexi bacterium]|nr:Jag N-terminal domain-containing protein [Chloroflexota bacterium]